MTEEVQCPDCHAPSSDAQKRGGGRLWCKKCGRWYNSNPQVPGFEYHEDNVNGKAVIAAGVPRIMNEDDLIAHFQIDTKKWNIDKIRYSTHEGYRKDRKVDWHVKEGKVTQGDVEDSGKMLVVPMFSVKVFLTKKVEEIRAREVVQSLFDDFKRKAKPVQRRKYSAPRNGLLYEVMMPDIHFGRLTWEGESAENYDIKIARQVVEYALESLLGRIKGIPISKIMLPLGNDFFNADNKQEETTHGTPQQEDTRWPKTFTRGRQLLTHVIERCSEVAPVDVMVVVGNHDETRMFYLGEVLDAQFSRNRNVTVNNAFLKRKYYHWGTSLIGFTHGYWEKDTNLPMLMAIEQPELWAQTTYREFHLGDKHHKRERRWDVEDRQGVTIRYLRSLCGTDTWTFDKGFRGDVKASEGFLWDKGDALVGNFSAIVPQKFYR